jgi:hypothetical protein
MVLLIILNRDMQYSFNKLKPRTYIALFKEHDQTGTNQSRFSGVEGVSTVWYRFNIQVEKVEV